MHFFFLFGLRLQGPCVARSCYCRKIRFKFQPCMYVDGRIYKFSLLTGRYAEQRRRRRRGRRRGRRYSSCDGVNYHRRRCLVLWHLQHHRSFHGQVHWFQLHRRSRRLQRKETCSSVGWQLPLTEAFLPTGRSTRDLSAFQLYTRMFASREEEFADSEMSRKRATKLTNV